MNRPHAGAILLAVWFALSACRPEGTTVRVTDLGEWRMDRPVTVHYEPKDSAERTDITLLIRKNSDYRYNGLRMLLTATSPDSLCWTDTLTVIFPPLPEDSLSRQPSFTDYEFPLRLGAALGRGTTKFELYHLMEEPIVRGIGGVGLKFE